MLRNRRRWVSMETTNALASIAGAWGRSSASLRFVALFDKRQLDRKE